MVANMNRLPTRILPGLLLGLSISLAACQGTEVPPAATEEVAEAADSPAVAESAEGAEVAEATAAPEPVTYSNFTVDELTRALLNEVGGQRGYLPDAARDYYALALETGDIGIIRRASQFASAMGDTEALVTLGRMWAEQEPAAIEPHLVLSYQLLESGRLEEAVVHMRQVLDLGGRIDFTNISSRAERLSPAQRQPLITALRTLREEYPDLRSLHYSLILLLEQNETPALAMEELLAYRDTYGESARVMLVEAQLLLQQDKIEETLQVLAEGVETYPDNRLMRFNYGRVLVQADDLQGARAQFEALSEIAPEDHETMYSLALIDLELDNPERAKPLLTRLLHARYRADDSNFYLGIVAEREGNPETAIAHYQAVSQNGSNFVAAQRLAVRLLISEGRLEEAHEWVLAVSEGNPRLQILLATVETDALLAAGHIERAEAMLTQLIDRYPQDTDLLFARALVSERLGNMPKAELDLRRIIDLEPQDARALNHLGYTLADTTDRYEEALELLERAAALEPDDPAIIDSLGWAQYKLGYYEEALENLQRAYAAFPDHEVAAHLGEVLWALGRQREANRIWEEALDERPDSDLLKSVMTRLRSGADS